MSDNDGITGDIRSREEEYFRRRDRELVEKLRHEAEANQAARAFLDPRNAFFGERPARIVGPRVSPLLGDAVSDQIDLVSSHLTILRDGPRRRTRELPGDRTMSSAPTSSSRI